MNSTTSPPSREPITVYRLWCGRKRHGGWRTSRYEAFRDGLAERVTFRDGRRIHLGPLAWLEVGQRRYARSKTVVVGREG
jgi:hypothetical protein